MYEECDKSTPSQEQLRKIVKTRCVVGDRPDPSTTTTTEVQPASELGARLVAKGYSQHVDDLMVDCFAATPSTTSLKMLLSMGRLQGHQTTCLDISTVVITDFGYRTSLPGGHLPCLVCKVRGFPLSAAKSPPAILVSAQRQFSPEISRVEVLKHCPSLKAPQGRFRATDQRNPITQSQKGSSKPLHTPGNTTLVLELRA